MSGRKLLFQNSPLSCLLRSLLCVDGMPFKNPQAFHGQGCWVLPPFHDLWKAEIYLKLQSLATLWHSPQEATVPYIGEVGYFQNWKSSVLTQMSIDQNKFSSWIIILISHFHVNYSNCRNKRCREVEYSAVWLITKPQIIHFHKPNAIISQILLCDIMWLLRNCGLKE